MEAAAEEGRFQWRIGPAARVYAAGSALIAWFGFALQIVLFLQIGRTGLEAFLLLTSYFTTFSNIIAALCLTAVALSWNAPPARFFRKPRVAGAAAVYTCASSLIYILGLRHLWDPQGWVLLADILLHYVMPILYAVFWVAFAPKGRLRPWDAVGFLVVPLAYAAYVLARALATGFFPYPILDVGRVGWAAAVANGALLAAVFLALGAFLVLADRLLARAGSRRADPSIALR